MRTPPPRSTRRLGRGAVAVEFGLVLLFLVPLVIGTVEFGRALYYYDTLAKSVRSAARYLSVGVPSTAARQLEATCIVVTGSPAVAAGACSQPAQLPGLTAGMVTILEPSTSNAVKSIATGSGTMDMVTVSVTGFPASTLGSLIFPNITLGPISVTVPHVFF
jgi:Flp pilus assembly protein TadG